jgi:hypothetical protein
VASGTRLGSSGKKVWKPSRLVIGMRWAPNSAFVIPSEAARTKMSWF